MNLFEELPEYRMLIIAQDLDHNLQPGDISKIDFLAIHDKMEKIESQPIVIVRRATREEYERISRERGYIGEFPPASTYYWATTD